MSLKYNLSQRYTNHSLRVTSLQTLDDAQHIIRVSGHKSVSSVENYARKLSTSRKRSISSVLSERVENIQNQQQSEAVSTSVCKGWLARTATSSNISVSSSSSANDLSDNILASLPAELFTGSGAPFTPIFHNCSNIHFIFTRKNIAINNKWENNLTLITLYLMNKRFDIYTLHLFIFPLV